MTKSTKISATIDRMSGASNAVSTPCELRQAESAGAADRARSAAASRSASEARTSPRFSAALRPCSSTASASPSTTVLANRGSMKRSVRIQPTTMISTDEERVKNQLFNGFTVTAGSSNCAAACEIPDKSGSSDEGTKLALKPPETPANAAAIPASG